MEIEKGLLNEKKIVCKENKQLPSEAKVNGRTVCEISESRLTKINLKPRCPTLKDLIEALYAIFENDSVNVEEVDALMRAYKSYPAEWLKYAKFDRYRYTRNLVDAGNGKFNLMVLCWGEGQASSIHDHANSHCFMKILTGSLSEIRYEWPQQNLPIDDENTVVPMKEISRTSLNLNDVCYINDSIGLHRVENLSYSESAVSLHLYCPPFEECKMFDMRTGRCTTAQVVFWSMFGERKKKKASKIKNDIPEPGSEGETISENN